MGRQARAKGARRLQKTSRLLTISFYSSKLPSVPSDVLQLSPRITCLPVIHGSGDFALAVRRLMLEQTFDCVAVPLPPSFQADVERGIELLPSPTIVTQPETPQFQAEWSPE